MKTFISALVFLLGMGAGAEDWLTEAEVDLECARILLDSGQYSRSGFHSQQAVEKALKSLLVARTSDEIRTHDLPYLADQAGAPKYVRVACETLDTAYTSTRYPGKNRPFPREVMSSGDAKQCATLAEVVIGWVKSELRQ